MKYCKRSYNNGKNNPMYGRHRYSIEAPNYGKHFSDETRKKISRSKLAENNPLWKGDNITKNPLHQWIKRRLMRPELCQQCKKAPILDLANISGQYKRDLNDWIWLCRKCHMLLDGRMDLLKQYQIQNWKKNGRYWGKNKHLG